MAWFEHEGSRIYYEDEGKGDPVLVLPGWSRTIDDLSDLRRTLSRRYRVIGAEPPGAGRSEPKPRHYTPDYHWKDASAFLALLHELGASPAHVVGYSDGGDYALVMALIEPGAVRSIVSWGAAGMLDDSMEIEEAFSDVVDNPHPEMAAYSEYLKETYGVDTARTMVRTFTEAVSEIIKAGGDISRNRAGEIACPALLLAGEDDTLAPPAMVAEMAAAMPRGEFIEVKGAGHAVHRDKPDWLAETTLEWLAKASG